MGEITYNSEEIINDFLTHDYSQSELARYYDSKYFKGYISSQTISKILNNPRLDEETARKIEDKKNSLKSSKSSLSEQELKATLARLDRELIKIVHTKNFINEENIDVLRVVCLYMSGASYQEIASILGMSKSTVSKYVNKSITMGILTKAAISVVESRLGKTSKFNKNPDEKRLEVIDNFISNNGNYKKTLSDMGISERTLSRYLSDEGLEDLLSLDKYNELKQIIKMVDEQKRLVATAKFVYNRKIQAALNSVQSVRGKYFKILLSAILLDNETNFSRLVELSGFSADRTKEYLESVEEIEFLFGSFIATEYRKVKDKILVREDNLLQREVISYYLRSRCTYNELTQLYYISRSRLSDLLKLSLDELKPFFGEDIKEKLAEHIEIVSDINKRCPKGLLVVNRAEMIECVREDVIYVNKYQYDLIKICALYLGVNGNATILYEKYNLAPNYVYSSLKTQELQDLLNKETRDKLNLYLKYENLFSQNSDISAKWHLMTFVMNSFCQNEFDVERTLREINLPIEIISRLVNDDILFTMYIDEIVKTVRHEVSSYKSLLEQKRNIELIKQVNKSIS